MSISVNIDKARVISHAIRRKAREVEFAPLDAVIAKQIPGTSATAAEASRAEIREKYAALQTSIDAATTVDALTAIVKGLGA